VQDTLGAGFPIRVLRPSGPGSGAQIGGWPLSDPHITDDGRPAESRPLRFARLLLDTLPRALIGLLLLAMIMINLANVIGRHAFDQALFWAEEIMKLGMVWGVFLGAIAVTYRGNHLRMDLLSSGFGRPWSTVLNVVTTAVFVVVACYIAYYSYQVVQIIHMTGRVSDAAQYPMILQHLSVFVGLTLMIVAVAACWRLYLFGRDGR